MDTDFYITARSSKFPIDYAHSSEEAAALLLRHRDRHPDPIAESTADYFERSRAETLASFPLSRITRRFCEAIVAGAPDARLAILPEAGHLSNLENPSSFNAALRPWLAGL